MAEQLTDEQIEGHFAEANADLKFLLDREKVDVLTQARLFSAGVHSVKQLAALVKDADGMRKVARDFLLINSDGDLKERVKVFKLVVAYESAKGRAVKMAEIGGEAEVRYVPKKLIASDFHGMREAFEKQYWALEDTELPSRGYLEKKLEMVEKDDLRAEKLGEVANGREDEGTTLKTIWDSSNTLSAVEIDAKVPLPQNPKISGSAFFCSELLGCLSPSSNL